MMFFMRKDITGQRFGLLVALHLSETPSRLARWRFKCDCGNEHEAYLGNVVRGATKSCGCLIRGSEILGLRFGRLVAQRYEDQAWVCQCDCGSVCRVTSTSLRKGNTKSCGCLRREKTTARNTTHGLGRPEEFFVWANMRNRCNNPNNYSYPLYGGRGIKVCERWDDFANFLADMGKRPSPKHSIDRKNNELDYGPENCRWTTAQEQANNRRSNRRYEFRGEMMTVRQAIIASGSEVKFSTIKARLKRGVLIEDALHG